MQMKTNDEIIEIIKKTVLDYLPDNEVLLFGSRARKNASLESCAGINFLSFRKILLRRLFWEEVFFLQIFRLSEA
jgi:hypothetical protein